MKQPSAHSQRGVALLIVLLLLATLSIVAIGMTQGLRGATGRALSAESVDQTRWYALGAEALAQRMIRQQWDANPASDTREEEWLREPVFFPIDNGQITASLRDATLCFNVNSLVMRDGAGLEENPEARERFELLLEALGLDAVARETVAATIIDWIDTDSAAGPDGAEDGDYTRLAVPYRTGNGLLADESELRAMMWMSPELYTALRPWLCVHPTTAPSPMNVNLATPRHAPLFYAAFAGQLEPSEIETLLGQIPAEGFATMEQVWELPVFSAKDLPDGLKQRFRLYSSWLDLEAKVNFNQAFILQRSLLEVGNNGAVTIAARSTGPDS